MKVSHEQLNEEVNEMLIPYLSELSLPFKVKELDEDLDVEYHKVYEWYECFTKSGTKFIVHTTPVKPGPKVFVNASNIKLKLGSGISEALQNLCGDKLQSDMNAVKDPILFNCYVTNNNYDNAIETVHHVTLKPNMEIDEMRTAYAALTITTACDPEVHTVLLGAGVFNFDPQTSFDLFIGMVDKNINATYHLYIPEKRQQQVFRKCTIHARCIKEGKISTLGDGHCLLHAIAGAAKNVTYNQLLKIYKDKDLTDKLFNAQGDKLHQPIDRCQMLAQELQMEIHVHTLNKIYSYLCEQPTQKICICLEDNHYSTLQCMHNNGGAGLRGYHLPEVNLDYHPTPTHNLSLKEKISVPMKYMYYDDYIGNEIYEMSAAPGKLIQYYKKKGLACHVALYKPGDNYNLKDFKGMDIVKEYKSTDEDLITQKYDTIILDVPAHMVNVKKIIQDAANHKVTNIIMKDFCWHETEHDDSYLVDLINLVKNQGFYKYLYMHHPHHSSSEVLCMFSRMPYDIQPPNKIHGDLINFALTTDTTYTEKPAVDTPANMETREIEFSVESKHITAYLKEVAESDIPQISEIGKAMSIEKRTKEECTVDGKTDWKMYKTGVTKVYPDQKVKLKVFTGCAGSGKTHNANKLVEKYTKVLYVTSTQSVMKSMNKNPNINGRVVTQHKALTELKNNVYEAVLIDECQDHCAAYYGLINALHNGPIYVDGDPNQIGYIDRNNIFPDVQPIPWPEDYNLKVTYRCPVDIAMISRSLFNVNMYSKGKKNRSIFYDNKPEKYAKHPNKITFTQATKNKYGCSATVGEIKGATIQHAVLIVDSADDQMLAGQNKQLYTALTRHTDTLVIVETNGDRLYNTLWAALHEKLEETPIVSTVVQKEETGIKTIALPDQILTEKVPAEIVKESLDTVLPKKNDYDGDLIDTNNIEPIQQGILKLNPDLVLPVDTVRDGKGFTEKFRGYTKYYNVANTLMSVQTLSKRYAKKTAKNVKGLQQRIDKLLEGVRKFTQFSDVEEMLKACKFESPEQCATQTADYLDKLQIKLRGLENQRKINKDNGFTKVVVDGDETHIPCAKMKEILQITQHDLTTTIQFLMKNQSKYIGKAEWDAEMKVGQGIAAVSKTMNIVTAACARQFFKVIRNNLKPNVLITSGENIIHFKQKFVECVQGAVDLIYVDKDASEFDSCNGYPTLS